MRIHEKSDLGRQTRSMEKEVQKRESVHGLSRTVRRWLSWIMDFKEKPVARVSWRR